MNVGRTRPLWHLRHPRHPLQRFLHRHHLSQAALAGEIRVSRETVNRWIRLRNTPLSRHLLGVLSVARRFEPATEVKDLFPIPAPGATAEATEPTLAETWGPACVLCEVPWDVGTEHLPLAILDPDLGDDPLGDLCEACAARVSDDDSDSESGSEE